MAFFTALGLEV